LGVVINISYMLDIDFGPQGLMNFFAQYAYQPTYVYGFITLFMFASSFGFPIPEELVLISAGLVAYMAQHPDKFVPPFPGAEGVDVVTLCIVCFLAVFISDFVVFLIGKFFGGRIIKTRFFQRQVAGKGFDRINSWFQKYGGWACGIFRFTPGLRFPGHLSCGLLGIPAWKFVSIDGFAALISVPTQVYFVSKYGEVILQKLSEFKKYVSIVVLIIFAVWLIRKIYLKNVRQNA
jgi:membrane protein DedA with SNARE-associated domain